MTIKYAAMKKTLVIIGKCVLFIALLPLLLYFLPAAWVGNIFSPGSTEPEY